MAQKKQTYKATKSTNAKNSSKANSKTKSRDAGKQKQIPESAVKFRHFVPFILIIIALLLAISFVAKDFGVIGNFLRDKVLFGIFSSAAYLLPLVLMVSALMMLFGKDLRYGRTRAVCVAVLFLMLTVFFHVFFAPAGSEKLIDPVFHYKNGVNRIGGGFIGGLLGSIMVTCFSKVGTAIIIFAVMIAMILIIVGKTPHEAIEDISNAGEMRRERRMNARLEAEMEDEARAARRREAIDERRRRREEELSYGRYDMRDDYADYGQYDDGMYGGEYDPAVYGEIERKTAVDPNLVDEDFENEEKEEIKLEQLELPDETTIDSLKPVAESSSAEDNDVIEDESVFEDPGDDEVIERLQKQYLGTDDTLSVATYDVPLGASKDAGAEIQEEKHVRAEKKEYIFPRVSFLIKDKQKKALDPTRELREKEALLIDTLQKFGVKTESAGLPAKGPTITRYELRPAPGTRVRSILNLSDDIALSMAAQGVRIAPVPGKSAIGVEVPNDSKDIVRLRDLIDSDEFRNAPSKLNVALGKDVAGVPVMFNIAEMPHMLIAGATGMGKSVCINCLIVSILYKASPDDVKLILIDPKKVEFNLYESLPHLLVPVVSDPKKAAGALSWAVNEMERRYDLIESVGARNIAGYNEIAEGDAAMEKMPHIVIIIDEFADLMMTAPDSVENSVCRLAQKARAAGMHMLIGTQRPSVDVITGTIKSNIPSRIACKTSSQVDSRTILDIVGAEKLIGKGDMLFSPVGSSKPTRVQGAFVTDGEIDEIVAFIAEKNKNTGEINSDIMSEIENEAVKCSKKKGSSSSESVEVSSEGEEDAMFWRAVELAVESGKISTSLIQRKCSLGFGRAAKLIDRMEELGFVTPPDGQKPRQVLLTAERLSEIKMSSSPSKQADTGSVPF